MLIEQLIEMKWNINNREWLESKGYTFTKYRESFYVSVNDLPSKSNKKVRIRCDYCGDETVRSFSDYTDSINESIIKKDSCMKCKPLKNKEAYNLMYGVDHQSQVKEIRDRIAASQRLDFEFIKKQFEDCNYELLTKEYINAKIPLEFVCNIHREQGTQKLEYSNFQQGRRCQYCNMDKRRIKIRQKYKQIVEDKDFIFVDVHFNGYHSTKVKLEVICKKHSDKGSQFVLQDNFKKQSGCRFCGKEILAAQRRNDISEVYKIFEERNYTILNADDYQNNKTTLNYICNKHSELGIQTTKYLYVRRGKTCKTCMYENITGENHYFWKGGISPLHNYLRCRIADWKKESLAKYNYSCMLTNQKNNLEVHHLVGFQTILEQTLQTINLPLLQKIKDYSDDELKMIENEFITKHNSYGLGVPLTSSIHSLFHSLYGRGNNTPDQFEEFKNRYLNGEFEEVS